MQSTDTKIKILLAEDDTRQRSTLTELLKANNYEVVAVENGKIAKNELLKEGSHYDLVLLDQWMPEMDGLGVLVFMQKSEKLKHIPAIMMTYEGEIDYLSTCLTNGAKDYVFKPLKTQNIKGLATHVERLKEKNNNEIPQKNPASKDADADQSNRIKILVADDDPLQRSALVPMLKQCGYEAVVVENGKQAQIELMKQGSDYDLALLDLMMPEMDGLELLVFMQHSEKLKDIPVIIMSSDGEMESVSTCLTNGAKDYLIKPIRIENMKALAAHVNPSKPKHEKAPIQKDLANSAAEEAKESHASAPVSEMKNNSSSSKQLVEKERRIKILVADDDSFQRLALIDMFKLCNYEAVAVENGKQAYTELMKEDSNFDLALIDLMMPEIDGLELLVFMKQTEKLKDIPVVIMSSNAEMESVSACLNSGAKDYLIKPLKIENVKGLVVHVILSKQKHEEAPAQKDLSIKDANNSAAEEAKENNAPAVAEMKNNISSSEQSKGHGNRIKILVADDDHFQRLSLADQLELYNYEAVIVENGKQAQAELMKEDADYDLALIDLMMPEMDGLELLVFMQQSEKLKDIPVIIMSTDGEMESVSTCLTNGAKDYLIKPIRLQNVKGLAAHVNLSKRKTDERATLAQYQNIRMIGKGDTGAVTLARNTYTGQFYAIKTIELKLMSPHERKLVENDIKLLRALNGPTIIHYYEHFTENDTIYAVMEFAEGGNLKQRIANHKASGDPIPNDKILDWIAQLVLAISRIHSMNIIHGNISSSYILLNKNDIVKLAGLGTNFGRSQATKLVPSFTSPEMCNGEACSIKSDIWSFGCLIYQLATLKKPFEASNLLVLSKKICTGEFEPLPENVDPTIKMLIYSMLQKNPAIRANISEIAKVSVIKERILKFANDHNCKEAISYLQ